jgi:hypothetical protein
MKSISYGMFLACILSGFLMPDAQTSIPYGFYYRPDTLHYRESDLQKWLPLLQQLGAQSLVIPAVPGRAVPETFIQALKAASISPIVHLHEPFCSLNSLKDVTLLIEVYAGWGVDQIIFGDKPNLRSSWKVSDWVSASLVGRFVDYFIPRALVATDLGITAVLPPLEPGGDYWDLSFLHSTLHTLAQRGHSDLVTSLTLGAYAWTHGRRLDWGAGGPDRWSQARPYQMNTGGENHLGLHIFEWYRAVSRRVLGLSLPILLVGMGSRMQDERNFANPHGDPSSHAQTNLHVLNSLQNTFSTHQEHGALAAGHFWLLTSSPEHPEDGNAWCPENRPPLPVVELLQDYAAKKSASTFAPADDNPTKPGSSHPKHYLLVPDSLAANADWVRTCLGDYLSRRKPMLGTSTQHARHARRITIIGSEPWLPESAFTEFQHAGCLIEEIYGDGTLIASKLASL